MKYLHLAVPALLLSGAALAQTPPATTTAPTDPAESITELDVDKNGSISRSEATSNLDLSSQFVLLDQNGNGALEPAEFSRFEATGLDRTRGTPGAAGSPGTPGAPASPPTGSTPAPDGTSPPPSGTSPSPPPPQQ
jgi:hypothetical protein